MLLTPYPPPPTIKAHHCSHLQITRTILRCHSSLLAHSQAADRPLLTTNSYKHDTHNQYNRKRQHNNILHRPKSTLMNSLKTKYETILKIIEIGILLPEKPNITKLDLPSMGRKKKWWYDNSRQKRKSSYQNPPDKANTTPHNHKKLQHTETLWLPDHLKYANNKQWTHHTPPWGHIRKTSFF